MYPGCQVRVGFNDSDYQNWLDRKMGEVSGKYKWRTPCGGTGRCPLVRGSENVVVCMFLACVTEL